LAQCGSQRQSDVRGVFNQQDAGGKGIH
jgi:hypothetical protein